MTTLATYSRVYWRFQDEFPEIWGDDRALAWWLRLLILADGTYPAPAPIPRGISNRVLQRLIDAELVTLIGRHSYSMRGLAAERDRRSQQASASAQLRWNRPKQEGGKPASRRTRFKVLERDSFTCHYCGRKAPDVVLDVDHIKPVREGGTDALDNLVAACVDCNSGKSGHPLGEMHADAPEDARALLDKPSKDETRQAEQLPADALDAYYRLTGSWPSQKVRPWLTQLIDTHGDSAVCEALGAESVIDSTRNTLLGRVSDRLEREAHEAEKRRQAASVKAAEEERQKLASVPPEVLAANKDRVHQMMVEAGLIEKKAEAKP